MILTLPELASRRAPDVCIIGSGPAGMTLAVGLRAVGRDVLVLEAGGRTRSDAAQELYRGETRPYPYHALHDMRRRALGGASALWLGRCRPMDAVDFERRDAFDGTEWPISRSDLDPYSAAAMEILEIAGEFADTPLGDGVKRLDYKWSDPPVHFGEKYIGDFEHAEDFSLCLNANLTGLDTEEGRVTAARVRDHDGNTARVEAGVFVLACGAIENCRLLLHFNAESEGRLVPQADTLGRYWMAHPHSRVAEVVLADAQRDWGYYLLDAQAQAELGILNCQFEIRPAARPDGRMRALAVDIACAAPRLGAWAWGLAGRELSCAATVVASWEQVPRADNRVELGAERDTFGIPYPAVHVQGGPEDIANIRRGLLRFGEFMARNDLGRIRMDLWLEGDAGFPDEWLMGRYHKMGGTRMSRRPGDGIVDADLKVWGQDNLYVAGASVFPSSGHPNPVFPICQLSLRLADHLDRRL